MCCKLKLDLTELRKRGCGLFGSNPLTGSIGVVTINLPNLGYVSSNEDEFCTSLYEMMAISKDSLEIERKVIKSNFDKGMYPFTTKYLSDVKSKVESYWTNHTSTIGLVRIDEYLLNLLGCDITNINWKSFMIKLVISTP